MNTKPTEADIMAWLKATERQILRVGDNKSVLLHCRFEAALERVWTTGTNRSQFKQWFADVKGDLREGATLVIDVGAPFKVTSKILQCEPLRSLRFTWSYPGRGIDEVAVQLTAEGGGTVLKLEHCSDDQSDWWCGAGSGWELALLRLSVLLRGDDPSGVVAEELDQKLGPLWMAAGQACV